MKAEVGGIYLQAEGFQPAHDHCLRADIVITIDWFSIVSGDPGYHGQPGLRASSNEKCLMLQEHLLLCPWHRLYTDCGQKGVNMYVNSKASCAQMSRDCKVF